MHARLKIMNAFYQLHTYYIYRDGNEINLILRKKIWASFLFLQIFAQRKEETILLKKICFLFTFTHFNISRYKMFIRAFIQLYIPTLWYKRVPKQNVHNAILCMWFWLLVGNLTCASDLWVSSYIFHLFGRMPWGGMKNK